MQDALASTSETLLTSTPAQLCPSTPNIPCNRKDSRSPDSVYCKRKLAEYLDPPSTPLPRNGGPRHRLTETISAFGECVELFESCSYDRFAESSDEKDTGSSDGESTDMSISHLACMNVNTNGKTKTHGPNQTSEIDTDEMTDDDTGLKKVKKINMDDVPLKPIGLSLSGSGMQLYVRVDHRLHKDSVYQPVPRKMRTETIKRAKRGRPGKFQTLRKTANNQLLTNLPKALEKAMPEAVLVEMTGDDRPSSVNKRSGAADDRREESYNDDGSCIKVCGWDRHKRATDIIKSQFQNSQSNQRNLTKNPVGRPRQKNSPLSSPVQQRRQATERFTSSVNRHRFEPEDDDGDRTTPSGTSRQCITPDPEAAAVPEDDDFANDDNFEDEEQMIFTSSHLPLKSVEQPLARPKLPLARLKQPPARREQTMAQHEQPLTRQEQPHPNRFNEDSYRPTHHRNINDNMARKVASYSDISSKRPPHGHGEQTNDDLYGFDPRGKERPEASGYSKRDKGRNNSHNIVPGPSGRRDNDPVEEDRFEKEECLDPTVFSTTSTHLSASRIAEFDLTQVPLTSLDAVAVAKFTEYTQNMRRDLKENFKNLSTLIKTFNQEVIERNKSTKGDSESGESKESRSSDNDNQRVCAIM